MADTCREEKQSARTMRPKILRAKGNKKGCRETREDFSRERQVNAFCSDTALEKLLLKFPRREEKFSNRPRAIKE
jgi:hypothetical protein